jgi:hypothetical protein
VPYFLFSAALRHVPATSVGIIGILEPVFAAAIAWLALGEHLNASQLAGGALILIGVTLAETARVRRTEPGAQAAETARVRRAESPQPSRTGDTTVGRAAVGMRHDPEELPANDEYR